MKQIKTALLSYGMSGKVFHAPFLNLHEGFELTGAWERSNKNIRRDYPAVRSFDHLEELLKSDCALVVVNTPVDTHFDYAERALRAGKHVVVEKAFTTTVAEAETLQRMAQERGLKLIVYQNRRWDSDFKTVRQVLEEQSLGEIVEAEIRYERYKPELNPKRWKESRNPGAGLLMDLGPHIIDQALTLFGFPQALFADIRLTRALTEVDDYLDILLYYPRHRVRLKSGLLVKEPLPAYILHGAKGSFLKERADEEEGNYYDLFEAIYQSIANDRPEPVSAQDGINVMKIIEAARRSNETGAVVSFL
jgi:predicted dehydrogenase